MTSDGKRLGVWIRQRRKEKNLTLKELSKQLGISIMTLQRIETGKTPPSFFLVAKLARILELPVKELFGETAPVIHFLKKGELKRSRHGHNTVLELFPEGMLAENVKVELYESKAGAGHKEHSHRDFKALYLLSGKCRITYGGKKHILNEGDSIYFDCEEKHAVEALKDGKSLVITIPKS